MTERLPQPLTRGAVNSAIEALSLAAHSVQAAYWSAGPPEETPTCAGRSSRSPIVKPSPITWMMSPALVPGTGASNIAWCSFGSKRSPASRLDLDDLVLLEGVEQVALGELDALDQARRRGAHRVGDVVERAVEVVVDRQQVAGEAGGAVDLGVAAVALGALADVLDVGERPEQPVLELGDLGAERRRLVALGGLGGDLARPRPPRPRGRRGSASSSLPSGRAGSCCFAISSIRPLSLAAAGHQPADQLRGVVDDRHDPAVVQPRRPDHPDRADDLAVRIHIGRDHQRGTRK